MINMLSCDTDISDLKYEMYNLRKNLATVVNDNQMLKIKNRKIESELKKCEKQFNEALTSSYFSGVPKTSIKTGAKVLMDLKLRNNDLEQLVLEKEALIRRLQNDIKVRKVYNHGATTNGRKLPKCPGSKIDALTNNKKLKIFIPIPPSESNVSILEDEQPFLPSDVTIVNETYWEQSAGRIRDSPSDSIEIAESDISVPTNCGATIPIPDVNELATKKATASVGCQFDGNQDTNYNPKFMEIQQSIEKIVIEEDNNSAYYSLVVDRSVQYAPSNNALVVNRSTETFFDQQLSNTQNRSTETLFDREKQLPITQNRSTETLLDKEAFLTKKDYHLEIYDETIENPHAEFIEMYDQLEGMIFQVSRWRNRISNMKEKKKATQELLKIKSLNLKKLTKEISELKEECATERSKFLGKVTTVTSDEIVQTERKSTMSTSVQTKKKSSKRKKKEKKPEKTISDVAPIRLFDFQCPFYMNGMLRTVSEPISKLELEELD